MKSALATAPSPDVMLLADRGFANHDLMDWLRLSSWHYAIRLPCDVLLQGASRYPTTIGALYPRLGEACLIRNVGCGQMALTVAI